MTYQPYGSIRVNCIFTLLQINKDYNLSMTICQAVKI